MSAVSNRILEREHDAVHRHRLEVGICPEFGVELGGALERIRQLAKEFARRRRTLRQRSHRGMKIEAALAGHRAFAADVERSDGVDLACVRLADNHAELLLHARIGRGRLHAAEFQRRTSVLVEVRQDRGGLHGFGRKAQRRGRAHGPGRRWHGRAVLGQQQARDAVIGTRAVDVALHDLNHGGLARPDRLVQLGDGRLFQRKRRILLVCRHVAASAGFARPSL